jgi:NADH-quinone oxidoreductase subunit C
VSESALRRVAERFPAAVEHGYTQHGDETLVIGRAFLVDVAKFCKEDPELDLKLPISVTCVDWIGEEQRFELVYTLYSISKKQHLRLKVRVPESDPTVPSVTSVWRGMDYWERYCWDMYGVKFTGRGHVKRLWMYEEFVGHPLRKDYPLRGRQPLVAERDFADKVRGPGPGPSSDATTRSPTFGGLPIVK